MDQHKKMLTLMKQKLHNSFNKKSNFLTTSSKTSEKLPPRFQFRGISIAARVVAHEIREITYKNTGKDLAELRENKTRQRFLENISKLKTKLTCSEAKYSYLVLAYNHNSHLTSSLSPDSEYCVEDKDFEKNSLRNFIAQYHKRCLETETDVRPPKKPKLLLKKKEPLQTGEYNKEHSLCRCNTSTLTTNQSESFLSCWIHHGIKEEYLDEYCETNEEFFNSQKRKDTDYSEDDWKEFIKNEKCRVFRKLIDGGIYEYRVQATFSDISANSLFRTQIDGEYRKRWDEYIIDFKVVDKDDYSNTELVHWITRCPYPFATRDYVYLRRKKVDDKKKMLVLFQQATDDTNIPQDKNVQRVNTYVSKIIIKPHHNNFDESGCDFLLTYYDDPKMMLPQRIMDIAASKGIKDSVERMHMAAQQLMI